MPQGGARGQYLGHLKKYFFFVLFFSYVINHIKRTGTIQG